jgi:hypothetical protein
MFFFYVLSFFIYKIREQEGRTGSALSRLGGLGMSGMGEVVGKGYRKVNIVQKIGAQVCKCKNDTCSNCPMNWGRRDEGEQWRG